MAVHVLEYIVATDKTALMFGLTEAFKDAIAEWSQTNDRSTADVCRTAIAEYIGYDLAGEQTGREMRGRPTKYNSPEERKAAQKAREAAKRELVKSLLAEHEAAIKAKAIAALQATSDRNDEQAG
jgi:hypothetical protein